MASILLVGALSMFMAEALSGSSVLWFLTAWGWLVAFPLYLGHTLLFVNLALRFGRTSLASLYLWGVLFALYESWITKVTWAGYAGATPAWGTLLGFAMPEFPVIVGFWHPVFSWILPLLAFEVLGGSTTMLPNHRPVLLRTRRNVALLVGVAAIGALFLAMNAKGDALAVVATIAGSVALIALLLRLAEAGGQPVTIDALRLGRRGMRVLVGYLVLLYVAGLVLILPERLPGPLPIALTVVLYAVVVALLSAAPRDATPDAATFDRADAPLDRRDLGRWVLLLTVLGIVVAVTLPATAPLVAIAYLAIAALGPALFATAVIVVLRGRTRRARTA